MDLLKDLITVQEVSERLGLSPRTVVNKCRREELPGVKFSGKWVFERTRLEQFFSDEVFKKSKYEAKRLEDARRKEG